jgi:hypothetical protein
METYQILIKKLGYKPYFDWVKDYWTTRGAPLDFISHKYLVQIYQDQSPNITYKKSAQTGLTEKNISEAMWLVDQFKENALYLFPTSGTISDIVQERVDEPINNSPYLASVSGRSKKIMGKQADKIGLKRMSKGFIYFRGANASTQITSVPADIIFVDELDRMEPENVPYFTKRLGHSSRKWQRWFSTPTVPNYGIDELYNKTCQYVWHVKCNHCGQGQELTFWDNIKYDINIETIVNPHFECQFCHKTFVPYELEGEWIKHNPTSDKIGYFISQLYSPHFDIVEAIEDSLQTAEYRVMQFYNQTLGLAYEPKGSKITEEELMACIRNYANPFESQECVMGVDVGKVLHVITRNTDRITDMQELKFFDKQEAKENGGSETDCLEYWIERRQPKRVIIDALPETRKAQNIANKFKGRVLLCYYTGLKEVKDDKKWYVVATDAPKVNTDRTMSLDVTFAELQKQEVFLPNNLNSYPLFKKHLKNLVRIIIETDNGKSKKAEYQRLGDDHFAHGCNYAKMAIDIIKSKGKIDFFSI